MSSRLPGESNTPPRVIPPGVDIQNIVLPRTPLPAGYDLTRRVLAESDDEIAPPTGAPRTNARTLVLPRPSAPPQTPERTSRMVDRNVADAAELAHFRSVSQNLPTLTPLRFPSPRIPSPVVPVSRTPSPVLPSPVVPSVPPVPSIPSIPSVPEVIPPPLPYRPDQIAECSIDENGHIIDPVTLEIIQPDRLISVPEGSAHYCFDIETLYKHVKTGKKDNPFTRQPLAQNILQRINEYARMVEVNLPLLREEAQVRVSTEDPVGTIVFALIRRQPGGWENISNDFRIGDTSLYDLDWNKTFSEQNIDLRNKFVILISMVRTRAAHVLKIYQYAVQTGQYDIADRFEREIPERSRRVHESTIIPAAAEQQRRIREQASQAPFVPVSPPDVLRARSNGGANSAPIIATGNGSILIPEIARRGGPQFDTDTPDHRVNGLREQPGVHLLRTLRYGVLPYPLGTLDTERWGRNLLDRLWIQTMSRDPENLIRIPMADRETRGFSWILREATIYAGYTPEEIDQMTYDYFHNRSLTAVQLSRIRQFMERENVPWSRNIANILYTATTDKQNVSFNDVPANDRTTLITRGYSYPASLQNTVQRW